MDYLLNTIVFKIASTANHLIITLVSFTDINLKHGVVVAETHSPSGNTARIFY